MTKTEQNTLKDLVWLVLSHQQDRVALKEITNVIVKLMANERPDKEDMDKLSLAYQRDPMMGTLEFQELQEFIESKFGEEK